MLAVWRGRANSIFAFIHVTQAKRFEQGYDPAAARALLEEALTLAEQTGEEGVVAAVQVNLGNAAKVFTSFV